MPKLTDKRIKSIKPAAKAKEHRDGHMPGLYLAVHPSGVRSWNYRYRVAGKGRKLTIGRWPAITVVDVLPIWKDKRLSEITKADVRQLIDACATQRAGRSE